MSDLDELMARDPVDLSSADIDAIIAFQRAERARRAAGEKPKKPAAPSIDISSVVTKMLTDKAPVQTIKRRI